MLRGPRIEILTRAGPIPGVVARRFAKRPKPGDSVSIPLRYMHADRARLPDDVERAARLVAAFAQRLGPDLDLAR